MGTKQVIPVSVQLCGLDQPHGEKICEMFPQSPISDIISYASSPTSSLENKFNIFRSIKIIYLYLSQVFESNKIQRMYASPHQAYCVKQMIQSRIIRGPSRIVENMNVPIQKNTAKVSHLRLRGTDKGDNSIPKIFMEITIFTQKEGKITIDVCLCSTKMIIEYRRYLDR